MRAQTSDQYFEQKRVYKAKGRREGTNHLQVLDRHSSLLGVCWPRWIPLCSRVVELKLKITKVEERSANNDTSMLKKGRGKLTSLTALDAESTQGLSPTPSGNHPFVPPTATSMMR